MYYVASYRFYFCFETGLLSTLNEYKVFTIRYERLHRTVAQPWEFSV